jgi:hypothetical protein
MQFPRAVPATVKSLILLALGAFSPISSGEAATKCPSGQILRVSLGTCVPKQENLSLMSRHIAPKPTAAKEYAAPAPAPEPAQDAAASADPRAAIPPVQVAGREVPRAAEQQPGSSAQHESAPLSTFGSLFVGAFHSTMSMGAAAFR